MKQTGLSLAEFCQILTPFSDPVAKRSAINLFENAMCERHALVARLLSTVGDISITFRLLFASDY